MWNYTYTDELYHHGVKGMKWGKRKARYTQSSGTRSGKAQSKQTEDTPKKKGLSKNTKRAIVIGAAAAGTALAAYGTYKASKYVKDLAGKRSLESGKQYAQKYFDRANKALELTGDFSAFRQLHSYGRQTLKNTDKRTRKVSKSTVEAIKYLRNPGHYVVDGSITEWW